MRVVLIDDEFIPLELLSILLKDYKDVEIVGRYTEPHRALKEIKDLKPDVIFLDIEMGETNGLDFAEEINEELDTVEIVFVTAYSEYAIDAFELNAVGYILKPIQEKRLKKTIDRLRDKAKSTISLKMSHKNMRINSLGSFYILDDGQNAISWRTQKTKELFAYLWKNQGRAVSKMLIMEDIFPDKDLDRATTLLHTTVYQLRKNLSSLGYKDAISYVNESYQLDIHIYSDIQRLEELISLKEYGEHDIEELLILYKGDLFQEEGYHWALETQIQYKEIVLNILRAYAKDQFENGNYSREVKYCLDKMFYMDPYNEEVARMIIDYYGKQGKRNSLEIFFDNFKKSFAKEMGLPPEEDTKNLYELYMN